MRPFFRGDHADLESIIDATSIADAPAAARGPGGYPAGCFYATNDGYSGWFNVNGQRTCTDFCFWDTGNNSNVEYTTLNTANPHETTTAPDGTSQWRCSFNSASNDVIWDEMIARARLQEQPWLQPNGDGKFPYLRCIGGANEALESTAETWVESSAFWSIVLSFFVVVWAVQLFFFVRSRRRRPQPRSDTGKAKEASDTALDPENAMSKTQKEVENKLGYDTSSLGSSDEIVDDSQFVVKYASEAQPSIQQRRRRKRCKKCLALSCLIFGNLVVGYIIFMSILALVEIGGTYTSSFALKQLTPACTATDTFCSRSNSDIFNPSTTAEPNGMKPFSYLIASDAQLDWYDGESAYIGRTTFPPPCTSSMSCGQCTNALASYTNAQMKSSIEKLLANEQDPVRPQTLIMNGDLTAYFHRFQQLDYESFYHNIAGLSYYFPALGNHDYDHNDATYNTDQWVSPKSCNAAHGMIYFKGGFCDKIPHFDRRRVLRYHAKSLAYSWEEGRYHFVSVHYFPTYEHAKIDLGSSMEWLDNDIKLAHEAGRTTILIVHAAQGLNNNQVLERVLLKRNVAAIFAGHTHRCLFRKCEGLERLNKVLVASPTFTGDAEKCLPATTTLCGRSANGNFMSLYYLKDMEPGVEIPERELFVPEPKSGAICPQPIPYYVNETDQTMLCKRVVFNAPYFPPNAPENTERIPIFWSGSASFETFLRADFYEDRFVVNALTAENGTEGQRYVDTHDLPNAVYPYYNKTDLEEAVIFI